MFIKAIHEAKDPQSGFKLVWLGKSCENCLGLLLCVSSQKSSGLWSDEGEEERSLLCMLLYKGGCEAPGTEKVMCSAPVLSH